MYITCLYIYHTHIYIYIIINPSFWSCKQSLAKYDQMTLGLGPLLLGAGCCVKLSSFGFDKDRQGQWLHNTMLVPLSRRFSAGVFPSCSSSNNWFLWSRCEHPSVWCFDGQKPTVSCEFSDQRIQQECHVRRLQLRLLSLMSRVKRGQRNNWEAAGSCRCFNIWWI